MLTQCPKRRLWILTEAVSFVDDAGASGHSQFWARYPSEENKDCVSFQEAFIRKLHTLGAVDWPIALPKVSVGCGPASVGIGAKAAIEVANPGIATAAVIPGKKAGACLTTCFILKRANHGHSLDLVAQLFEPDLATILPGSPGRCINRDLACAPQCHDLQGTP